MQDVIARQKACPHNEQNDTETTRCYTSTKKSDHAGVQIHALPVLTGYNVITKEWTPT